MNHEVTMALNARLDTLLDIIERVGGHGLDTYVENCKREATAIVATLVGDDPKVWQSIRWLRGSYEHSDLVLRDDDGPKLRLRGNEHWVLADVEFGDSYGALDFLKPYAIWRNTGALYLIGRDSAVADNPIYVPS